MLRLVAMHPDQIEGGVDVVEDLIGEQFPHWAELPIRAVSSAGTVNAVFRVGDRLSARSPVQPGDPERTRAWLAAEHAAGQRLHGRTRFPTPEPLAIGEPGAGYPLPWSVQTWLKGTDALAADPAHSVAFAEDLAEFVLDVRAIDTEGETFTGDRRGGDLRAHESWVRVCLERSVGLLDVEVLSRLWLRLRDLPAPSAPDVMTHGDLIPGNVLVAGGRLTGLLDVGGLAPADPALDLVGGWHLLDPAPRSAFRRALGSDDLEWARGAAWAFIQAIGLVWYYDLTNPVTSRTGRRTLQRLIDDPIDT